MILENREGSGGGHRVTANAPGDIEPPLCCADGEEKGRLPAHAGIGVLQMEPGMGWDAEQKLRVEEFPPGLVATGAQGLVVSCRDSTSVPLYL